MTMALTYKKRTRRMIVSGAGVLRLLAIAFTFPITLVAMGFADQAAGTACFLLAIAWIAYSRMVLAHIRGEAMVAMDRPRLATWGGGWRALRFIARRRLSAGTLRLRFAG